MSLTGCDVQLATSDRTVYGHIAVIIARSSSRTMLERSVAYVGRWHRAALRHRRTRSARPCSRLRMSGAFYCHSELTEPWGLTLPRAARLHVVPRRSPTGARAELEATGRLMRGDVRAGHPRDGPRAAQRPRRRGARHPGLEREHVSERYEACVTAAAGRAYAADVRRGPLRPPGRAQPGRSCSRTSSGSTPRRRHADHAARCSRPRRASRGPAARRSSRGSPTSS